MDIFLLSNGKLSGNPQWLSYAQERIRAMIKTRGIRSAVLIAYAVIRADHDQRARELSEALGIDVTCIEHFDSPVQAVENAECILVSGGNTWLLNQLLHENGLVVPIQRAIRERNIPYIGWSAGCNVATPSIRTTNDMPVRNCVVMPSLGLFPVQINPHYIDAVISGHMGETRDERIAEFCAINPMRLLWRCVKAAASISPEMSCTTSAAKMKDSNSFSTTKHSRNNLIPAPWQTGFRSAAVDPCTCNSGRDSYNGVPSTC